MEPTWSGLLGPILHLLEHGETAEAKESARGVFRDMAEKLDAVRREQIAREKAGKDNGERFLDYEYDDYLLIDENNRIQAVSGNSDFWDEEQTLPSLGEVEDEYTIVKVIRVHKEIELQD